MKVFAEIEQSKRITVTPTIKFSPVWQFVLWNTYVKHLAFMADTDPDYPTEQFKIGSIFIDQLSYIKVNSLIKCWENACTYFIQDNILYVHFLDHMPSWVFYNYVTGVMYGFTNKDPELFGASQLLPDLLQIPKIEISSDIFTYGRMKFNSGNVIINNSNGIMDGIQQVFGNNLNILYEKEPEVFELLMQFYIASYNINSNTATFSAKDKRERLSNSCPNTFFNKETFPFIDDKYKDRVIPDAYGQCVGVPAIPIEGNRIYVDSDNVTEGMQENDPNWLNYYSYKVARKITKISRVQVKMSDVNGDDIWVEVFPGLGVIDNTEAGTPDPITGTDRNFAYQEINPQPIKIVKINGDGETITLLNKDNLPDNNGIIQIYVRQALKDNPGFLFKRGGRTQDVKIDGVFNDMTKPADIAKDIIKHYSGLPNDDHLFFNVEECYENLGQLPSIGIVLKDKKSIYDYIERIQNGCLLGWQMLIDKDRFTARLDNPNRAESFVITEDDIINVHDVEVELDGENYATYTEIKYNQDISDDLWQSVIDRSSWNTIMDIYKFDKVFENESLLLTMQEAAMKGRTLLDDFSQVRPIIRGIELIGKQYFNLKLFQIGSINFTIALPERLKQLQPYMNDRTFMGKNFRCKIINKSIDIENEKVIIDVRQCDISKSLPLSFFENIEINGETPSHIQYTHGIDNKYANTNDDEFELILDAGGVN